MILTGDKDILEQTETKLIADLIRQTILSRFRKDFTVTVRTHTDFMYLYYVKPETGKRCIEFDDIVDKYLNEQYKILKERLKEHYVVKKNTRLIDEPFKREKRYHFIIENSTLYYDFYLVCELVQRPGSCHYHSYKFYINNANEITLASK